MNLKKNKQLCFVVKEKFFLGKKNDRGGGFDRNRGNRGGYRGGRPGGDHRGYEEFDRRGGGGAGGGSNRGGFTGKL